MANVARCVSVDQAAEHCGAATRTIRRWIKAGRFGNVETRPEDGALLISRAALAALSGRVYTGPDIPPPYSATGGNRYTAADVGELLVSVVAARDGDWRAWLRDDEARREFPDGPPAAPK